MEIFSDGPAGEKAIWWLGVINAGELSPEAAEWGLAPGAHPLFDVHTDEGRQGLFSFFSDGVPWRLVSVAAQSSWSVEAVVEEAGGGHRLLRLDVEPEPPHRITLAATPPLLQDDDGGRSASSTAALVAGIRASHLLWDEEPIFVDDLAIRLVPDQVAQGTRRAAMSGQMAGAQLMIVVRSRYAEDALFDAIGRGTTQYVLLGAGLDSFAYRHPDTVPDLRVFEVDQPASQQYKRTRLAAAGIAEPKSLTFVAVDFENERLDERLAAAGFDLDSPAFFAWLGVVYYLGTDAIEDTLGFIGTRPTGTEVVFDYIDPTPVDGIQASQVTAGLGEPLLSKFTPAEIADLLGRTGLQVVQDLSPADAAAMYFVGRPSGRVPTGQTRVVHAHKVPSP